MIERVLGWLIPPACREEVLGDLQEERAGIGKTLHTALCVILSRIRRTSDPVVLLMEALSLYTAFALLAEFGDRALLMQPEGWLRLAIPPAAMLIVLMLSDAYADPRNPSAYRSLAAVVLGSAACAASATAALPPLLAMLAAFSGLVIAPIRIAFPPLVERPKSAAGPAFWQKLELAPLGTLAKYLAAAAIFAIILLAIASLR